MDHRIDTLAMLIGVAGSLLSMASLFWPLFRQFAEELFGRKRSLVVRFGDESVVVPPGPMDEQTALKVLDIFEKAVAHQTGAVHG